MSCTSSLEASVTARVSELSVGRQFTGTYGQSQANISALTSYLAHFGITTAVYPDDVDVVATGTAGDFDKALSVTQRTQDEVPATAGRQDGLDTILQLVHGTVGSRCCPTGSRISCWPSWA